MDRRQFTLCGLGAGIHQLVSKRGDAQVPGAAKPASGVDRFALVDPELLAAVKGQPPTTMTEADVANSRKQTPPFDAAFPSIPGVHLSRRVIPGPAGPPDVRLVIADPAPQQKDKPVLLHIREDGRGGQRDNTGQRPTPRLSSGSERPCA